MLKIALNLNRLSGLFDGNFRPILDVARRADEMGFDQIMVSDHLALIPAGIGSYPYGQFTVTPDTPMAEAVTLLSAVAAVTERARLSMSVLIAPLRSALLLAKQLSMLDVISNGRLDAALGAGWQREEFEAAERTFQGRFNYLEEQVEVCRILWANAPATFKGKTVQFEDLYVLPHPVQGANLPIWFGLGATGRNVERIARMADGWVAPPGTAKDLAASIASIHNALRLRGRDTATFPVRAMLRPIYRRDGSVDFDQCYADAVNLKAAGVNMLNVVASVYCRHSRELQSAMEWFLSLKNI